MILGNLYLLISIVMMPFTVKKLKTKFEANQIVFKRTGTESSNCADCNMRYYIAS